MTAQGQQRTMLVMVIVIAGVALSACSSTPAGSTAASAQASVGADGSVEASVAATATPAASAAIVSVDLIFTGTLPLTAKGTGGQCMLGQSADGSVLFGFSAVEADYPGLGDGLFLNEDPGSHRVLLKWLSAAAPSLADLTEGQGLTYSSDHKSITIDADIGSIDKPEHLSGTISCP